MGDEALHLSKHHGAGNDFLVLLDVSGRRPISAPEARALCDRHRGIGADGVLRATLADRAAALTMDLHNADGSMAEMSGNGIRCLVQAAVRRGLVSAGTVDVATGAGLRRVHYEAGPDPELGTAEVEMGCPVLGAEVPVDGPQGSRRARRVDLGNPHVVVLGEALGAEDVAVFGPRVAASIAGGVNVEFVWPGTGADELCLRVWERGVGETLACGTGACAVAAAARDWGICGDAVRVTSPGGTLEVVVGAAGALLRGPTRHVADVEVGERTLAGLVAAQDASAMVDVAALGL
jgi:diaminopimelate epimerase